MGFRRPFILGVGGVAEGAFEVLGGWRLKRKTQTFCLMGAEKRRHSVRALPEKAAAV